MAACNMSLAHGFLQDSVSLVLGYVFYPLRNEIFIYSFYKWHLIMVMIAESDHKQVFSFVFPNLFQITQRSIPLNC